MSTEKSAQSYLNVIKFVVLLNSEYLSDCGLYVLWNICLVEGHIIDEPGMIDINLSWDYGKKKSSLEFKLPAISQSGSTGIRPFVRTWTGFAGNGGGLTGLGKWWEEGEIYTRGWTFPWLFWGNGHLTGRRLGLVLFNILLKSIVAAKYKGKPYPQRMVAFFWNHENFLIGWWWNWRLGQFWLKELRYCSSREYRWIHPRVCGWRHSPIPNLVQ